MFTNEYRNAEEFLVYYKKKENPERKKLLAMLKRTTAILILLAICVLPSCGIIVLRDPNATETSMVESTVETTSATDTTSDVPEDTTSKSYRPVELPDNRAAAEAYLAELPEGDFGGSAISIITSDVENFSPSSGDDVVYNARIERNRMVEKKYDTIVMTTAASYGQIYEELRVALKADDYYADIIAVPQNTVGLFAAEDMLMNMMSLPFTDYTAPYFNTEAIDQLYVGYDLYGVIGDFNENLDYLYGLYFNRDMATSLGYDLYGMVYEGKWDFDAMRRVAKDAAALDGVDGHGSSGPLSTYESILFASSGIDYFDCGRGKLPTLGYAKDDKTAKKTDEVVQNIRRLLYSDGAYLSNDAMAAFTTSKLLFYTDRLYFTSWIGDMADNWGILPFPSSGDGYYTYADWSTPVICVPKGSANSEFTGKFIQAANAASYGWVDDVFYENLSLNIIRDGDTLNMLDIINGRNGGRVLYSFAHMFGGQLEAIANASYGALLESVRENYKLSSYQKNHEANVKRTFEKAFPTLK